MFGYVGEGGTIQNVTLTNATVSGNKSVGGLVGKNYGTVSDNTVSSKVTGTGDDNGGVVGSNYEGGKVTDNYYYSNVGAIDSEDDENNTRLYKSLELPDSVNSEYTGSDDYTLTIDGTTYYKSGAPFKLTVTEYPEGKYLKGATVDDDGNFIYTLSDTAVEWADVPTIGELTFNSSINGFNISTAADLQALATYVNAGNDCAGLTFKLTAIINLTGVSFTPIGKYENWNKIPFSGTFDGAGYTISNLTISNLTISNLTISNLTISNLTISNLTISNLTISNLTISNGGDYVGLFGYVGKGGTIKNVTLTDATVEGFNYVGALVGENEGGTVTNCIVSGEVTSTGDYVGGVVAYNYGTVSGNTAFITFSGGDIVGGLVGRNNSGGTVTDNKFYSNKDAIGSDSDSGTVENNTRLYLFTELEGVNSEYTVSGNLKVTFDGKNYYASGATFTLTVTKYTDGKYLKGATFIGNDTFTYTISSTAVEWADIPTIGNLEFDRSINGFNISTAEQLQALATFVNGGGDTTDLTFKLADNIDLSSVSNWTPIGNSSSNAFKGTFDGDGHKISNLTINISSNNVGLFGYVSGGTVQNLTLDTVRISGSSEVGGLVGTNKGGTVTNCTVSGNTVTGNDDVGGLVGWNDGGTVTDSTVDNVSLFTKDTHANVGGLVGYNKGIVSGNTVSNGTITDTNTSGREGGLVGLNYKGTVSDNTVDAKITVGADAWVGGVAGRNNDGTVTGNVAVSEITAGSNAGVGSVVGYEEYNSSTIKNNFFHSTANDVVGKFYYSGTNENITNNNPLYVVTLPGGVEITGDSVKIVNGKTYAAGNITVAAKTGYVYSGNTSVEITADTDLSKLGNTTLDTSDNKHYVFKDGDTYTLATADNVATAGYPDLEQVYALTLQGVTVSGDSVVIIDGTTYATGDITVAAKTGYTISATSLNVTGDKTVTATLADGHYVFKEGNTYTLATAENIAANDYPELVQVYALTLPEGVSVNSGIYTVDNGKYYATGTVTLTTTGYTSTVTVDADHTEFTNIIKFNKAGTGVEVDGTKGDLSGNNGVYSISASQNNSTLTGNTKNNTVILTGGGENILTGGGGNDTYKFSAGGGIVTDFGIGATKDSLGAALSTPLGTDVLKVDGSVTGVYFDRDASNKKSATFTAVVTYGTGSDTEIIVLQNIKKKPTKYGSHPVYQTNDVAAATLKIWDTSGGKQAVLSASKLKKLFHDDSELNDLGELIQAKVTYLGEIADGNTPATNPFEQTTTITPNGGDNG